MVNVVHRSSSLCGEKRTLSSPPFPVVLSVYSADTKQQPNKQKAFVYIRAESGAQQWNELAENLPTFFSVEGESPIPRRGISQKRSAMKDAVCSRSTRESTQKLGNCPMTADISRPYSKYFNLSVSHTKRARYISERIKQLFRSWSPVFVRHRFPLLES